MASIRIYSNHRPILQPSAPYRILVQPWCHEVGLNEGRSMSKIVAVPWSIRPSSFDIIFSYRAGLDVTVIDRQPNHSPTPPSVCPDQESYILEMGRCYNDHGTVSHASHLYPISRSHLSIRGKFPLLSPLRLAHRHTLHPNVQDRVSHPRLVFDDDDPDPVRLG